ncbi:MAG: hypothetical protein EXS22_10445 [Pedosphaera sp.]|nr:hypothetical protein [Pedosphaera sp.]MSU44433.1 hypothetical protein [Pedosphaera sp.]
MDRHVACEEIKSRCKGIALELMRIHPHVPALGDKETQDALYAALYELTKQLEIVKKRVIRLEQRDDSPEL